MLFMISIIIWQGYIQDNQDICGEKSNNVIWFSYFHLRDMILTYSITLFLYKRTVTLIILH